jgi:hypothetical protein
MKKFHCRECGKEFDLPDHEEQCPRCGKLNWPRETQEFFDFFMDGAYEGCTLAQKVEVYFQHRPAKPAVFVLELLLELHPELHEDPNDDKSERTD